MLCSLHLDVLSDYCLFVFVATSCQQHPHLFISIVSSISRYGVSLWMLFFMLLWKYTLSCWCLWYYLRLVYGFRLLNRFWLFDWGWLIWFRLIADMNLFMHWFSLWINSWLFWAHLRLLCLVVTLLLLQMMQRNSKILKNVMFILYSAPTIRMLKLFIIFVRCYGLNILINVLRAVL